MPITKDMIDCWKTNFGLDTMTPEEAFRWWAERNNGMAPAGAVVAFGLALEEIERLRGRIEHLRGALKTAAGWFSADDKNGLAQECMLMAGDIEEKK